MSAIALTTALCLPTLDLEALLQGRTIAAISNSFRNPSQFLLCPVDTSLETSRLENRYHPDFLKSINLNQSLYNIDSVTIQAWARCKTCRIFGEKDNLAALSSLTAWSVEYLHELVQERHKIFVLFLQIHRFAQPIDLAMSRLSEDNIGSYIDVPGSWSDQGALALLPDEDFAKRQKQLIKLSPPIHPELHSLQTALVALRQNSLGAMALDRDLRYLLGWSRAEETQLYDSDLSWIQRIAQSGDTDTAAEFKRLVFKSWIKLGFSNADGALSIEDSKAEDSDLDVCCDVPFALIGKCQADRRGVVAKSVIEQIMKSGELSFRPDAFEQSIKVIFTAGPLTELAQHSARENKVNVMHPETLQRLTEMKARYPGSIDLLKLKACLQRAPYGEAADEKIGQFIEETFIQLKIRSAVIEAVKLSLENADQESVGIDSVCAAYAALASFGLPSLSMGDVQDVLIELSSPVAGYLGKTHAADGRELFYFLRELYVEDNSPSMVIG